jgi:YesN/AraC family two-component response regulator
LRRTVDSGLACRRSCDRSQGIAQILNEQQGISVVARAADGAEAVELFASIRPDVALIDLRMPKLEGVQVVEKSLTNSWRTSRTCVSPGVSSRSFVW